MKTVYIYTEEGRFIGRIKSTDEYSAFKEMKEKMKTNRLIVSSEERFSDDYFILGGKERNEH